MPYSGVAPVCFNGTRARKLPGGLCPQSDVYIIIETGVSHSSEGLGSILVGCSSSSAANMEELQFKRQEGENFTPSVAPEE